MFEAKKALTQLKKKVKLVSFDDTYQISFINPPILRVSSDNNKIGKIAANLIIKKIEKKEFKKVHELDYKIITK